MSCELHKYIIKIIREEKFEYNIEDFVEGIGLYYKTKKNNKTYIENFKYDININKHKSCIIEEEEYNHVVREKNLFEISFLIQFIFILCCSSIEKFGYGI